MESLCCIFLQNSIKTGCFTAFCMRCTVPDKTEKATQFRGKPKLRGFLKMFRGGE